MKAGDAFFCTQRLATLLSTNTRSEPTIFAFFQISHVDHAVMKDPALTSMWLEYSNASRYLKDENAGIIVTQAVAVAVAQPYIINQPQQQPLLDMSSMHIATAAPSASASAAGVSGYPTAAATIAAPPVAYNASASSPAPGPSLVRSPSEQQRENDFTPAMNPMFSSNTAGYSALPVDDEDGRGSVGAVRPSNQIQLQTFASSNTRRPKDGSEDLLL